MAADQSETATTGRQRTGKGSDELVFVALGGLGEVGMNCYLYGLGPSGARRWMMVDLGITFPEGEDDPGVDVILPDLKYIRAQGKGLEGLVVTHAHEDHIGAIIELWPQLKVPVYATPFTAAFLKAKLAENGGGLKIPITEIPLKGRFKVGPFDCELIGMTHSIPEPNGIAIRTPHGVVFHTGDWKLDDHPVIGTPADEARIQELGQEGVLALVGDSTNAFRDGRSPSELEVSNSLAAIIKGAERRVLVTSFASNVARIRAVASAAHASGRHLVVAGRALHRAIQVAIDTGYLPQGFRYSDQQEFSYLAPHEVLGIVTGSQGEPRAALARIAENQHPEVSVSEGDMVIFSSRTIPGNEKTIGRIQNALARMGVEIVTDNDALVHVTGHPRREELRQMYQWIKPRIAVPMHGEVRHLKEHARIAREQGVGQVVTPINGEMVVLAPGPARIIDQVPVGRLFRDGRLLVPGEGGAVRERRKLAWVGLAAISLVLSRKGEVLADPEIALDGIPYEDAYGGSMEDIVFDAVEGCLKGIPPQRRRDPDMVREAVRRSVRSAVDQVWGKKPIVKVFVAVVGGGKS
ncbi:MAG: ribonuclease J [Hyphomicrobiaceae bacterium]|nr:ribonuclease J [Hyphomicrobiaceae bacterium]